MKVIKRNGIEVDFDRSKIVKAIMSANNEVDPKKKISDETIATIASRIYERIRKRTRTTAVEEIQDMVEIELMKEGAYETAKRYIRYRCLSQNVFVPVLYSTGCVNCRTLKENLDSHEIQYEECKDVSKMIELGFDKVPMLEIANGVFLDYEAGMNWVDGGYQK
jgi:hypothetical protein